MNSTSFKALLLALLFLLGAGLKPEALASHTNAPQPEDRFAEFEQKFKQAMSINAKEEMAKLLERYSWESVLVIMTTCEAISQQSSDELEEFAAGLNEAWKKQYNGSEFVDKVYEYFSLLDPVIKRKRVKLKNLFESTREQYNTNINGAKDGPKFVILAAEFERFALGFEGMGDWYHASECWITYGACFDQGNRGRKDADLNKSCVAYKKALDARDKIELKDKRYREIEPIFKLYEKQGYFKDDRPDEGTGGTGEDESLKEDSASALSVPLTFEMIESVSKFARPNYHTDAVYPAWSSIALQGKDSSVKITGLEESPMLHRVGIADVRVDVAGDGPENDEKIKMTGNMQPVHFKIGSGPEEREFGFLSVVGGQTDQYQGIEANLAPGDTYCNIYMVAAGSMVGDLAGIPIRVIDDNLDGIYGSAPVQWGHTGVTDGMFQSDMDSIVVGASKRALPWSEFQNIEGSWYKFEVLNKGTEVVATPVELNTGVIKLKTKGVKADWMVIRGTGQYENCFFDLLQNGSKGVEVPLGYYELFMGRVSKGKKLQVAKALVLPGGTTPGWEVNEDKAVTVELGAPFGFHFQYDADEETINLSGDTIAIAGKSGERYERLWNCVPKAEVAYRKEGSKRGSKPEKMGFVQAPQELIDRGFKAAWFPLDIIIDRSKVEGGVSVQITEKKNKLFGKIASEWK